MTVRCEFCEEQFELPRANTENRRLTILFFAKCPHCGRLRNERSAEYPQPRCECCNIPTKASESKLCRAHYMVNWRIRVKSRKYRDFA